MNALIEQTQIIHQNGKPAFAVIPYEDFLAFTDFQKSSKTKPTKPTKTKKSAKIATETLIPHAVVASMALENANVIKAWRQHFRLTQQQLADKMGISQSALAQLEANPTPKKATLKKFAEALDLSLEQVIFD